MEFYVINRPEGLVPVTDDDSDEKTRLTLGETYRVEITLERNNDFNRKYFKMIDTAWSFLPEGVQAGFISKKGFRKSLEIAAGHCETVFDIGRMEYVQEAKSIAFDKMEQLEFEVLYKKVREVIDTIVSRYCTEAQFDEILGY